MATMQNQENEPGAKGAALAGAETRTSARLSQPTPRAKRPKSANQTAVVVPEETGAAGEPSDQRIAADAPLDLSTLNTERLVGAMTALPKTDPEIKRRRRLSFDAGGDGHLEKRELREMTPERKGAFVKSAARQTENALKRRALRPQSLGEREKEEGLKVVPPGQDPAEPKRWLNLPDAKAAPAKAAPRPTKPEQGPRQPEAGAPFVGGKTAASAEAPSPVVGAPAAPRAERKSFGPAEFEAAIQNAKRLADVYAPLRRAEGKIADIGGKPPSLVIEIISGVQRGVLPIEEIPREFDLQVTVGRLLREMRVAAAKQSVETHYEAAPPTSAAAAEKQPTPAAAAVAAPVEKKSDGIFGWLDRFRGR